MKTQTRLERAITKELPATIECLDEWAVARYAELLDERTALRAALEEDGLVVREVIVSPKGGVVGERLVANPLLKELRMIDRALDSLGLQLGLSPLARIRLQGSKTAKTAGILSGRHA